MPRTLLIAAGLLAVLALAGCDASVSTGGGIDSDEVAEEARTQLTASSQAQGGGPFPEIECPDELEEEKGSKMTCFSRFDGKRHEITAEVSKLEDDNATLDFTADALPSK